MSKNIENRNFFFLHFKSLNDNTLDKVEEKLNSAYDWYRINRGSYILYTSKNQYTWYHYLLNLVYEKDRLFISALDISNVQGWMPKGFWEWINEKISQLPS